MNIIKTKCNIGYFGENFAAEVNFIDLWKYYFYFVIYSDRTSKEPPVEQIVCSIKSWQRWPPMSVTNELLHGQTPMQNVCTGAPECNKRIVTLMGGHYEY